MPTPTTVAELRARMRELQSSEPLGTLQPTRADLARLLPGGGLSAGAVYRVLGSSSLAAVAMAEASASGSWCAFVGWPHLGAEGLAARLRERGCTLLVAGNWPAAQATIALQRSTFVGLEPGHGLLRGQAAEVLVRDRAGRERSGWLRLGGTASTDELAAGRWAERTSDSAPDAATGWSGAPASEHWAVSA